MRSPRTSVSARCYQSASIPAFRVAFSHSHAPRRVRTWCARQGVRHGSAPARGMLPRVLALLSFRDREPGAPPGTLGPVAAALRKAGRAVPLWAWLPWLPQLQAALLRPESGVAREILMRLAAAFPQPLHIGLRTALISLRDGAVKAVHEARALQSARDGALRASPAPAPGADAVPAATPPAAGMPAATPATGTVPAPEAPAPEAVAATPGDAGAAAAPGQAPSTSTGSGGTTSARTAAPSRARTAGGMEQIEKPAELLAFEAGKEIMEFIRSKHTHIASLLDLLLNDLGAPARGPLVPCAARGCRTSTCMPAECVQRATNSHAERRAGSRFVARAEERLLAVVHALLHRCYKMPFSNNAEVHPSLKKELGGAAPGPVVCQKSSSLPCLSVCAGIRATFMGHLVLQC